MRRLDDQLGGALGTAIGVQAARPTPQLYMGLRGMSSGAAG